VGESPAADEPRALSSWEDGFGGTSEVGSKPSQFGFGFQPVVGRVARRVLTALEILLISQCGNVILVGARVGWCHLTDCFAPH
jgi:hypothetical protein